MRILVVSDTHGNESALYNAISAQQNAELVVHLGDGLSDVESVKGYFPKMQFLTVQGNSDSISFKDVPISRFEIIKGYSLFLTHGHKYNVKWSLTPLFLEAKNRKPNILLFGHTHQKLKSYRDDMHILNPGSLNGHDASYATIDIEGKNVFTNIVDVNAADKRKWWQKVE